MGYKILMVLNGLDIGGAETHVAELSLALQGMGHQVMLASNGGAYVPMLEKAGLKHFQVPLHRRRLGEMITSRRLLKQIIQREQPDIVHAHARIPGFLCGGLQPELKFAFVTTAHWVYRTGFLLNRLTDWGQQTLAVSRDIRTYLMKNYRLSPKRITVTVNGIDTSRFSPRTDGGAVVESLGIPQNHPVVGTVSRLEPDRSLVAETLLQLAPTLKKTVPEICLVIVGGGSEYADLKSRADRLNRENGSPYVIMTGPRTDVAQIVSRFDVFVGVSRAALEAMAAAKPVILAGNEGHQGIFAPDQAERAGESNFCCRGEKALQKDALLQDVIRLIKMPQSQRTELGDFGRQLVLREFSVQKMTEDCLGVYDKLRNGRA